MVLWRNSHQRQRLAVPASSVPCWGARLRGCLGGGVAAAGTLRWATLTASNGLLCSQATASPSSVPPSLHASAVSNIFGARPPQPRESVLGISFKPYSPDSSPAPAPCTTCESTRKRMVPRVVSGHPGPGPTWGGEGWREVGNWVPAPAAGTSLSHRLVFPWGCEGCRGQGRGQGPWQDGGMPRGGAGCARPCSPTSCGSSGELLARAGRQQGPGTLGRQPLPLTLPPPCCQDPPCSELPA